MPPKKTSNGSARAAENKKNQPKTASEKSEAADLTRKAKSENGSGSGKSSAKDLKKGAAKGSAGSEKKSSASTKKSADLQKKSSASAKSSSKSSAKTEKSRSVDKGKMLNKTLDELKKSGEAPKKSHQKPTDDSGISCKTPQVMKLVAEESDENTVIAAGKSRIPARLKGKEPLSRMVKREVQGEFFEPSEVEVVNLTELAVQYEAPQILDRFNACSCEKCVAVFSEMVLKKLPARFARITKTKLGIRSRELSGRVEPVREMVQITMIRELIRSRKRIFHDE